MESIKIEPDRLSQDALAYECTLRGIVREGRSAKEIYGELSQRLTDEAAGTAEAPDGPEFTMEAATAELLFLADQAKEVRKKCLELEEAPNATERRRLRSELAHLYARARRFSFEDELATTNCSKVVAHLQVTCMRLVSKAAELDDNETIALQDVAGPSDQAQQRAALLANLNHSLDALGDPAAELAAMSRTRAGVKFPADTRFYVAVEWDESTGSHIPVNDAAAPSFSGQARGNKFQMHNWKVEFSGDAESKLSLSEFLEQVEWKRREHAMRDADLLRGAHNLFKGAALRWFRASCGNWNSFAELRTDLIANFRTADYEERL
ncbi:MAG: hypothetical protein ACRDAX_00925, partial [Propionibacteriaceae bacterium]